MSPARVQTMQSVTSVGGMSVQELPPLHYENESKKRAIWKWVIGISVGVVVLAAIGVGVYFLAFQPSSGDSSSLPMPTDDLRYRIPRDLIATDYTMYILPNMTSENPSDFTYHGRTTIHLTCKRATNRIVLHATSTSNLIKVNSQSVRLYTKKQWQSITQDPNCEMWSINGRPNGIASVGNVVYVPDYEFVVMFFAETLVVGEEYVLQLAWDSAITNELKGFYYSSYKDTNGKTDYLALTHFSSINARRAFPCMDEPDIKAVFRMRLLNYLTSNLITLSNTPLASTSICETDGFKYRMDIYEPTVISSTYHVAYTFSHYGNASVVSDGRLHRVFTIPEKVPLVNYSVSISPKILEYFEKLFDVPYDYKKMDHFGVPDFSAGAMENWGLVTYRNEYLWFDPQQDSISKQQSGAMVISHELAHMWFGNLVTITWFEDLWITEGWAGYAQYIGIDHVHPEWGIYQRFYVDTLWDAMRVDSSKTSRPLSYPVNNNVQVRDMYDTITYDKGASIMHMMRWWLGNGTFWDAMRVYLKRYSYSNSEPEYMAAVLTEQANKDGKNVNVTEVMLPWVYQGGYPVVKMVVSEEGGKRYISFSQKRFLLDATVDTTSLWQVPVTIKLSNGTQVQFLHKNPNDTHEFAADSSWFIGNHLLSGYYRVNYDTSNWHSLTEQLWSPTFATTIDLVDRAVLVDDSFNLARIGDVPYATVLNLTAYLRNDVQYTPWVSAIPNIDYLEIMSWNNATGYQSFTGHWSRIIEPVYNALGWYPQEADPALRLLLRTSIITKSCNLNLPDCVSNSQERYRNWTSDPARYPLDSNLRQNILCTAIRNAPDSEWQRLFGIYTSSSTDRSTYINALACGNNVTLLENWLKQAYVDNSIPATEFESIYVAMTRNINAKSMCSRFFYTNWAKLCEQPASTSTLRSIILNMFNTANTASELQQMSNFATENKGRMSYCEVPFNQAVDSTKVNIIFVEKYLGEVFSWLKENSGY